MVQQAVGSLSGGEKARLVLAMLVWQRPNLLLLDEPTNHLDLTTREALSMALNEFEGTVMLVSHDRALLRETCDEFWLVARGGCSPSTATWTTTRSGCWRSHAPRRAASRCPIHPRPWWRMRHASACKSQQCPRNSTVAARRAGTGHTHAKTASRPSRHASSSPTTRPLRIELQRIDERLPGAGGREGPGSKHAWPHPASTADAYVDLGRELAHVSAEIAMLEERWLELQAELEALGT
jgi:ATP-binding cassette subfamily F protein 3